MLLEGEARSSYTGCIRSMKGVATCGMD